MKRFFSALLTTIFLVCANFAFSQTITQNAAYGGQLNYITKVTVVMPPLSEVIIYNEWGFNTSFIPAFPNQGDTLRNNTSAVDTVTISDTVSMLPGNYFVRWKAQRLDSAGTTTSNLLPVTVIAIPVTPSVDFGTKTPTSTGGIQTYNYHAGYDSAKVKVYVSPGDTSFTQGFTFLVDTFFVIDSGIGTYTFTGYPPQYKFSYKFVISNSVGKDTTLKGWMQVLPSGTPWVGAVDSFGVTQSTITTRTQVVTNGSNIFVRSFIARYGQIAFDSVVTYLPGQAGGNTLTRTFSGLLPDTKYDLWSCIGNQCATKVAITTASIPIVFSVVTDSVIGNTATGKVVVYATVIVPSGETGKVGALGTIPTDVNYLQPLFSSQLQTFSQGLWPFTQEFTATANVDYIFRAYGFSGPSYVDGNSIHIAWRTPVVPAPARLDSITDPVCFGTEGWILIDLFGANFAPGAMYSANYYDGSPDVDTVQFISTSHVKVWVWNYYRYSRIDYTVTNPGAVVSNIVTTSVTDCQAVGIHQNKNVSVKIFPNPFTDQVNVETDQKEDYQVISITGQTVSSGQFQTGLNIVNLQEFPAGLYILRTERFAKQIVKQ